MVDTTVSNAKTRLQKNGEKITEILYWSAEERITKSTQKNGLPEKSYVDTQ